MRWPRDAGRIRWCCVACTLLLYAGTVAVGTQQRYVSYADVRTGIERIREQLPAAVREGRPSVEAAWNTWIVARDREIRARLAEGDEDTVLNWLLLGTAFTAEPPMTLDATAIGDDAALTVTARRLGRRLEDLIAAVAQPGDDDRRLFAGAVLRRRGFDVTTAAGRGGARDFLLGRLGPFLTQWTQLGHQAEARFETRGLSLDTSLQPNYALHAALVEMRDRKLVSRKSVRRVAVVGAGLDFADKNSGFDFYPPQTVQPFALIDSLLQLDLSGSGPVEIVAFDISPRVLEHIADARRNVGPNRPYILHLPLDTSRPWLVGFTDYWQGLGMRVGQPVPPVLAPTDRQTADVRALRLAPDVVRQISTSDTNLVTQRYAGRPFDLVVATNVLVYYDTFEQTLAASNVASMLRDGGWFLSNTSLPEGGAAFLRSSGGRRTVYTTDGVGDDIYWYQR